MTVVGSLSIVHIHLKEFNDAIRVLRQKFWQFLFDFLIKLRAADASRTYLKSVNGYDADIVMLSPNQ